MKINTHEGTEVLKLTLNSKQLLSTLLFVGKAIAANPVVVLLENVHVTIKPGEVQFTGDDYSKSISRTIEYPHIGETGSFMLPHKKTVELLKTLPDTPVDIIHTRKEERGEKGAVLVICEVMLIIEGKKFKLASEDHIDFPRQQVFDGATIALAAQQLKDAINACLATASTDDMKPSLLGIHFNTAKGEIVSCDGGNMTVFRTGNAITADPFTVSTSFARLVMESITPDQQNLELELSASSIRITNNRDTITSRLVNHLYADYQMAIPQNNPLKGRINLTDWGVAIRRSLIFASSNFATKNTFAPGKLILNTEDKDYGNDSRQEIDFEGDFDMEIGLQGKAISAILQKTESKLARLEMSANNRAILIYPEETSAQELLLLSMPVLLLSE